MKLKKIFFYFVLISILFTNYSYSQITNYNFKDSLVSYLKLKFNSVPDSFIYIDTKLQKLFYITDTSVIKEYTISTASAGSSFYAEFNSNKTPLGLHTIESKIGDSLRLGNIIKMKKILDTVGTIYTEADSLPSDIEDAIMTRVIVLQGEEKGINKGKSNNGKIVDTFYRGIYIHGTNNEAELGKAVSHGCIRMKNADIVELYNLVNINTIILIL